MNVAVNAYCNRVIRDMYTPYTLAIPNYFASPRAIYFHLFISKRVYLPTLHLQGPAAVNAANVRTRWFLIDIYFHARKKQKKKIRDKRQRATCIIRAVLSRRSRYCIPMQTGNIRMRNAITLCDAGWRELLTRLMIFSPVCRHLSRR